jgi:hypothetical protein
MLSSGTSAFALDTVVLAILVFPIHGASRVRDTRGYDVIFLLGGA